MARSNGPSDGGLPIASPALDGRVLRGIVGAKRALQAAFVAWTPEDDDERADAQEAALAANAALSLLERARWHEAEAEAEHALTLCEAWGRSDLGEFALLVGEVSALALDLQGEGGVPP